MDKQHGAGTPTIRGTDISVHSILEQLAENPDAGAFLADNPELTMDDVRATLAYAGVIGGTRRSMKQHAVVAFSLCCQLLNGIRMSMEMH